MKKSSKRTKGIEEARPYEGLSKVNHHAAGVDIGATEIVACVPDGEEVQLVKGFGNYTVDLKALAQWFRDHKIKSVAMESTGVYWIPLFEELERQGFECLLISSRSLRKVAGQKTDVEDAQWLQTLHSYGLLKGSFRPEADLVALRTLLRHRAQMVEHRAPHIQHMQKALLQMNIQLSQAVTDITGRTGLRIIRATVAGLRDPQQAASLRDPGCKHSQAEIAKALTGTWREEHLYVLKQREAPLLLQPLTQHRRHLGCYGCRLAASTNQRLIHIEQGLRALLLFLYSDAELITQQVHGNRFQGMGAAVRIQQIVRHHRIEIGPGHTDALTVERQQQRFEILYRFRLTPIMQAFNEWAWPVTRLALHEGRVSIGPPQRAALNSGAHPRPTGQDAG